jgi:pimeloyl-ACP methyl ester carboxylesterase
MNLINQGLLTVYYEDGPAGAPVVLMLHGWDVDGTNLEVPARALAEKYHVIRLDLPGFGGTQVPPAAWHVRDYADFVKGFLDKSGIGEPAAVLGHSFGGRVAIKGLGEGIFSAKKLILIDSAGIKPPVTPKRHAYKIAAKAGKAVTSLPGLSRLAPVLRRRLYQSAGSSDYLGAGALRETFINTINEDLSGDAARITVPALLVYGANDTDTPPEDGRKLANLIKHSQLSILAGAGHFAHTDAPDRVNALIMEFLS